MLVGLGALLLVAASIAFVAVAWTRLGLVFQAAVMLVVTTLLCGASAWTARKGLRATEEALAAAGAALLAVDLGAARALGLFQLEDVRLRWWWAISCAVVVAVTAALGRLTRSTATWPLVTLLAAQPLPFLVLPPDLLTGPAGVAAAVLLAAGDVVAARSLRRYLAPVAWVLAGLAAAAAVFGGLTVAVEGPVGDSWATTAVLTLAGVAAVALTRFPRPGGLLPAPVTTTAVAAVIAGLALAGSLDLTATVGAVVAASLGLVLLTLAVFAVRLPVPCAALTAAGAALAFMGAAFLSDDRDARPLALVILAATVPAALAAVRLPALRRPATGAALLAPGLSILLARADGALPAPVAGLLLALLSATAFALATLRARRGEEWVCAAGGALAGAAAGLTSADVGAWGQVGIQLGIAGAAAGCYAVVAGRRWVGVVAMADLVVASWIAVGGAEVETPEAYTRPAALGLLVLAIPQLRSGARSWAAEGAAVAVALVPSAVVVVADPDRAAAGAGGRGRRRAHRRRHAPAPAGPVRHRRRRPASSSGRPAGALRPAAPPLGDPRRRGAPAPARRRHVRAAAPAGAGGGGLGGPDALTGCLVGPPLRWTPRGNGRGRSSIVPLPRAAPGRRRSCSASAPCCWSAPGATRRLGVRGRPRRGCCCWCSPPWRPASPCARPAPGCAAAEEVLRRLRRRARPGRRRARAGPALDGDPVTAAGLAGGVPRAAPGRADDWPPGRWRPGPPSSSPCCGRWTTGPGRAAHRALPLRRPRRPRHRALRPAAGRPRWRSLSTAPWWLAGVVGGARAPGPTTADGSGSRP